IHIPWVLAGWWIAMQSMAGDDPATIVYWVPYQDIISQEKAEAWGDKQKAARSDLDLEASMRERGYFWVNGRWVKKGETVVPARSVGDLKDSDGDGFDDFTEVKFHTDPFDEKNSPEAYFRAKGSNRVIFYTTNATAHKK
ncbi:MAG: hypothetical protein EBU36_07315, partial [Verrucomicrobia bacterium]|nr:hypothetical protein [Verrucomicrobiota bacterium]